MPKKKAIEIQETTKGTLKSIIGWLGTPQLQGCRSLCPVSYTAWIAFDYPNNRASERCTVPIDSDERRSSVL
ncbi:hypothetical protein TNCV_1666151 [Trichonephila clavipes]|nr:hypothetical protein TNCV_1666151 [Trichonephila clavipes]